MRLIHGLPQRKLRYPHYLAAGVFDGMHVGHQAIISAAVQKAEQHGCTPAVLTFAPHPDTVLFHREMPPLLTTLDEKVKLLRAFGIQVTIVARFDRSFAMTPAEAFVRDILVNRLNVCGIAVGEGWRFGARGSGDATLLRRMSETYGFDFCSCPPVSVEETLVSSTRIRGLIANGNVEMAARYLGRPYQLNNTVAPGVQRGRMLGFPTANLDPPPFKLMPANGIYACWAGVTRWSPAVVSIGVRPTFETEGGRKIEVHLLEQTRAPRLTGRRLHVAFVQFLRKEHRYDSPEGLKAQIREDCAQAASRLMALQPPSLML